jgi:hypothetical protein
MTCGFKERLRLENSRYTGSSQGKLKGRRLHSAPGIVN